jgi:hypothetical protein
MGLINWSRISLGYGEALDNLKASVGAEIIDQILSIPDTVAFIEFIYEEAAQTALFALYNAVKTGDYEMADQIRTFIKHELLPDATGMIATWGALNPATRTCFQRFFDAVAYAVEQYGHTTQPAPKGFGTLIIYTDVRDVLITIDGEEKGRDIFLLIGMQDI